MKKIFLFTALLLTLCFTSCKTTSLKLSSTDLSSVAIVTVSGNSSIPWFVPENKRKNEDDGVISKSGLSTMLNKALRGNDAELLTIESRIDNSAEILIQSFNEYGIDVLPAEKVYEAPVLNQQSFNFLTDFSGSTPAQGYGVISYTSKVRNKEICESTGAKTTCFAEFEYRKYKKEISFSENYVYAHVVMKVYMADEKGNKIMQKNFTALSDDYVSMSTIKGYSKEKLVELFPSAIKNACTQLMIYLTGITPELITQNINESTLEELSDEQLSQAVQIKLPAKKAESVAEEPVVTETAEESTEVSVESELSDEPEVTEEPSEAE